MWLQARTGFNSELFGAEHLMLEDESASTSHQARSALADAIKTIAADKVHPCHGKRRDIVNLCPGWRLSMSLNNEPERMMILPRLTADVHDKISILRATRYAMPVATETPEEKSRILAKDRGGIAGVFALARKRVRDPCLMAIISLRRQGVSESSVA
jgi:hypothetical protein